MIKKIWNDPVWSQVISVGVIGLISFVYVTIKSTIDGISFADSLQNLIELKVRVIYVIALMLTLLIGRAIFKSKKGLYSKKREQLRQFNRNEDTQRGILYRWTVWFDSNDKPFISDLEVFCTRHQGAPLRFINRHCQVNGCENSNLDLDYRLTENHIESILIDKWDKIR